MRQRSTRPRRRSKRNMSAGSERSDEIECPTCGRQDRYHVARLLGPDASLRRGEAGFGRPKRPAAASSKRPVQRSAVKGACGAVEFIRRRFPSTAYVAIGYHGPLAVRPFDETPLCVTLRTAGTISESNCGLADPFHPERSYTIRTETRRKLQQLKLQLSYAKGKSAASARSGAAF
jgi:hypothetical protein